MEKQKEYKKAPEETSEHSSDEDSSDDEDQIIKKNVQQKDKDKDLDLKNAKEQNTEVNQIEIKEGTVTNSSTNNIQQKEWVYTDSNGNEQGPYTTLEIQSWWFSNLLPPQLKIKKVGEPDFTLQIHQVAEICDYNKYISSLYSQQYVQQQQQQQFVQIPNSTYDPNLISTDPNLQQQQQHYVYPHIQPQYDSSMYHHHHNPNLSVYNQNPQSNFGPAQTNVGMNIYTPEPAQNLTNQFNTSSEATEDRIARQLIAEEYKVPTFNTRTGRMQNPGRGWSDPATRQMSHYFDVEAWQRQCQESGQKRKRPMKVTKEMAKKFKEDKKRKSKKYQWLFNNNSGGGNSNND